MSIDKTLYARLGGKDTLVKVHKIFYDKAYAHSWLRKYFTDKPQKILEEQQTDFMTQVMGGPKIYSGKTPKSAHQHMVITEKLYKLRSELLSEAIKECGIAVDARLKRALIKLSEKECRVSYANQAILNFSQ